MDDAPLQLFELEAILTLHFLSSDFENLGKVTLENVNRFTFLSNHTLESILASPQPLFQPIDLVFILIALLGHLIERLGHFTPDFGENAHSVRHRRILHILHLLHSLACLSELVSELIDRVGDLGRHIGGHIFHLGFEQTVLLLKRLIQTLKFINIILPLLKRCLELRHELILVDSR